MNILIIIVVIAVVIGPVFWMMPSPQQKQKAAMREYAQSKGFRLKVCDLPQSHRERVRKQGVSRGISYGLTSPYKLPVNLAYGRLLRADLAFECGADSDKYLEPLLIEALKLFPSEVMAIELNQSGFQCYWTERGGQKNIDVIHAAAQRFYKNFREVI